MPVELLWLRDRRGAEAAAEAEEKINTHTGPLDLDRLLVIDDTSLLADHAAVFLRIGSARRVDRLLCIAVGPQPEDSTPRAPLLPASLMGTHGPGVLWVGDPDGIDWGDAPGTTIKGRKRGQPNGLERLVELLHVEAVFDEIWNAFEGRVRHRVASPGLRLVGADDEAAVFQAALALAIEGMTAPGAGDAEPFRSLLPDPDAVVIGPGPLAEDRDAVVSALAATEAEAEQAASFLRRYRQGDGALEEQARTAGAVLGKLRVQVIHLLQAADAADGLTGSQHEALRVAGLQFSPGPEAGSQPDLEPDQLPVFRAIADALAGGDTLPFIQLRLAATAGKARRYGSAAYLPQVDTACPVSLPASLVSVGELPAPVRRGGAAAVRQELGLGAAGRSATGLIDLVRSVATQEWSPAAADPDELERTRIALDGIQNALDGYTLAGTPDGVARRIRLSESLQPALRGLVCQVLKDEYEAPGATGQETLDAAERRAGNLLKEWTDLVQVHGMAARPKFAPYTTAAADSYAAESDLTPIREALQADPRDQMWQLCGQNDVTALHVDLEPVAVRFAPRQNKAGLGKSVPGDTLWLSAKSAGLLRLVPLHYAAITGDPPPGEPSQPEPE